MARIENLLAQCLNDIETGSSVEECLARYPQWREELEPLLRTAQRMHSVPQVTPSSTFQRAARTRMLNTIQARASAKDRHTASLKARTKRSLFNHVWPLGRSETTVQKRIPVFRFATAASLVFILLIVGGILLRSWLGVVVAQTATLADVSGVVKVLPAGHDTWQVAATGDHIATGDRIRTGTSTAATLVFFDGSTTSLTDKTELTVSQLSSRRDGHGKVILLHQRAGRTYNRVQRLPDAASRFEIETPTAIATVHGTVFIVEVISGGATQVVVGEGIVEVTAQEATIAVLSGQATTVQPGLPPVSPVSVPTPLPPATMQPTEPPILTPTPEPPSLAETPQTTEPPEDTPYSTGTPVHTPQPTETPILFPTWTPTPSLTWTPTNTPTPSPARVPARTPRPTWTPTNTPRPTWTPTNTPRPTWTPTNTPRPTWTPTNTPRPTWTPTNTPRPTWTPTNTPRPTNTPTPTPIPTNTPTPTPIPTWTPTNTPRPTWTPTNTPRPTNTPTNTPVVPTDTPDPSTPKPP